MVSEAHQQRKRRFTEQLFDIRSAVLLCLLTAVIAGIEYARLSGTAVPAPFLIIFGSAAIVSALRGLASALIASGLCIAYVAYAAVSGFGPQSLTGGLLEVTFATLLSLAINGVLGYEHDTRSKLLYLLRKRERELLEARERLTGNVAATNERLQRARGELSDSRYQMEQAMHHAPIGVIAIDDARGLQFINDAALQQLGSSVLPDSICDWDDLVTSIAFHDASGKRLLPPDGPVSRALRDGTSTSDFECYIVGIDGQSRWCNGYVGPILNTNNEIIGALLMLVDTTLQRHASRALQRTTQLLFKLQEEERSSLARELHEEIAQTLAAIKLTLHRRSETGTVDSSLRMIDDLTAMVRQLSLELRPTELDDFGLQAAVENLFERTQESSGIEASLNFAGDLAALPGDLATAAFRVLQEAAENVMKHAEATRIRVGLAVMDNHLTIDLSDNGAGFDVEAAEASAARDGRKGLLIMRERARQAGGLLEIGSGPNEGTRIRARLPLHQE